MVVNKKQGMKMKKNLNNTKKKNQIFHQMIFNTQKHLVNINNNTNNKEDLSTDNNNNNKNKL